MVDLQNLCTAKHYCNLYKHPICLPCGSITSGIFLSESSPQTNLVRNPELSNNDPLLKKQPQWFREQLRAQGEIITQLFTVKGQSTTMNFSI